MGRRNSMEICERLWLACPMDCSCGSLDMNVERQRTKSEGIVKGNSHRTLKKYKKYRTWGSGFTDR